MLRQLTDLTTVSVKTHSETSRLVSADDFALLLIPRRGPFLKCFYLLGGLFIIPSVDRG